MSKIAEMSEKILKKHFDESGFGKFSEELTSILMFFHDKIGLAIGEVIGNQLKEEERTPENFAKLQIAVGEALVKLGKLNKKLLKDKKQYEKLVQEHKTEQQAKAEAAQANMHEMAAEALKRMGIEGVGEVVDIQTGESVIV
jgi:hypothetical protein